jgi:hypothetical protein
MVFYIMLFCSVQEGFIVADPIYVDVSKVETKTTMVADDKVLFNRAGAGPFQAALSVLALAIIPAIQSGFDARYAAKGTTTTSPGVLTVGGVSTTGNVVKTNSVTVVENVVNTSTALGTSNPVTAALTGTRTFNATNLTEFDLIPFATLQPGDVVNIFHNAIPYNRIIRISDSGTAANPIIINGVTNANGDRPVISGANARVTPGSMPGGTANIFNSTSTASWAYREGTSLVGTACRVTDPWNAYRPKHIQFKNLEIVGAVKGNYFYDNFGTVHAWDQASGFRVQEGEGIIGDNLVIHNNDFGYFTQAYNGLPNYAPLNCVLRNSRIYDCGMVGRSSEHGAYIQGIKPILENNWFGPNKIGSLGSTIKLRAAGFIIRHNWMMSSDGRLLDIVQTEDSNDGVRVDASYGYGHVYGNVITNLWSATVVGASFPIHIGGDNAGEDKTTTEWIGGVQVPTNTLTDADLTGPSTGIVAKYIHTVYFYDNTVVFKSDSSQKWRCAIFDLSLSGTATNPRTKVWEWNNAFRMIGTTRWSRVRNAGHVAHMGGSVWDVDGDLFDAHEEAKADRYSFSGTPKDGVLGLVTDTWLPTAQTLTHARLSTPPTGLPASFVSTLVANRQIGTATNSLATRNPVAVGALDVSSATSTPVSRVETTTTLESAPGVTADTLIKDETSFSLTNGSKKAVASFNVDYTSGCSSLTFEALVAVSDANGIQQTIQQRVDVVILVANSVITVKSQSAPSLSSCLAGTLTLAMETVVYNKTVNLCLTPTSSLTPTSIGGYVALSAALGSPVAGLALLT